MGDKRDITLPARFHKYLRKPHLKTARDCGQVNQNYNADEQLVRKPLPQFGVKSMQIKRKDQTDVTDHMTKTCNNNPCTEEEIHQALRWIQQQIGVLKEEDHALMQQFSDLRARIRKLRSQFYSPTIMDSDIIQFHPDISVSEPNIHIVSTVDCRMDSHSMDLGLSPHQSADYLSEFRERTVSMVPPKIGVTKVMTIKKYKTEGFL